MKEVKFVTPTVRLWYPNGNEELLWHGIPPRVGDWVEMGEENEDDHWGEYRVSEVIWIPSDRELTVICKTDKKRDIRWE